MILSFKAKISKCGRDTVGFIYAKKKYQDKLKIGQQLKITININNKNIIFFAKVRRHNKVGVYVPKSILNKYLLIGKKAIIIFEEMNGFFTKTSYDGRVYIPQQEAEKLKLKQNEIICLEANIDGKRYSEFCQIRIRQKRENYEYFCMFHPHFKKKEGIFHIKEITSRNKQKISQKMQELLLDFNYAPFHEGKHIVVYYGNREPIIIKSTFNSSEIAHYLGCYFADGTKKGNSWGICASTFDQARYFVTMHNTLVENPDLKIELTYTDPLGEDKNMLRERLQKVWVENAGLKIPSEKIWIYKTNVQDAQNRNTFGALSLREHKQLLLIYYNRLLHSLIKEIIEKKNRKLGMLFICGVLEGDGAPSAKGRGHIVIATNKEEVYPLVKVFETLGFKHEGYNEEGNKSYIRIGSLELIEHIDELKDILFKYYKKRRKRTIERLLKTGAALYILGITEKTSPWVLKRFRDKGILNKENELTSKGENIKNALLDVEKSVTVM